MKSVMIASQSIKLGSRNVMIAGGFENLTQVPFYIQDVRLGKRMGNGKLIDGLLKDGLTNPFNDTLMGVAAEKCAEIYQFSREAQDDYTILSFANAFELFK